MRDCFQFYNLLNTYNVTKCVVVPSFSSYERLTWMASAECKKELPGISNPYNSKIKQVYYLFPMHGMSTLT